MLFQNRGTRNRGQVILMVTVALIAMCGMLAFAVDFGWAFFVKRATQRAADSAAMAAALHALSDVGAGGPYSCGADMMCQAATPCPSTVGTPVSNIDVGCAYANENGFRTGGANNRQLVTIEAAVTAAGCTTANPPTCIPTAPGVAAYYYVTARVSENVPQLFSAVLGHPVAEVSSRATAAVVDSVVTASLMLLNREHDASGIGQGANLVSQGGSNIRADGGILLSSQCYGSNCQGNYAGKLQGGTSLRSPYTFIRGVGQACAGNLGCTSGSSWIEPPINGKSPTDRMFLDPMRGKGQPELTTIPQQSFAFDGGFIPGGTASQPTLLPPGNYYATSQPKKGPPVASGAPITLGSGYFRFGSCNAGFQDYVFFGGITTSSGSTVVTFTPGRYVLAGQTGGPSNALFSIDNKTTLQDCTPSAGRNTDGGEIFIFTDTNYPGLDIQIPTLVAAIRNNLQFGVSGIKTGNNDQSSVTLHGLNKENTDVISAGLEAFGPFVFWQDQRNSNVRYNANGNVDISCGNLDNPCTNPPSASREMFLRANANLHLYGAAYQPRGAWLTLHGGGSYSGAMQIITGAVDLQGSPPLTLIGPSNPITYRVATLVE